MGDGLSFLDLPEEDPVHLAKMAGKAIATAKYEAQRAGISEFLAQAQTLKELTARWNSRDVQDEVDKIVGKMAGVGDPKAKLERILVTEAQRQMSRRASVECPNCGAQMNPDKDCPKCGKSLDDAEAEEKGERGTYSRRQAEKETVHLDSGDVEISKGKLTRMVGGPPSENMDKVRDLAKNGTDEEKKAANFYLNILHKGSGLDPKDAVDRITPGDYDRAAQQTGGYQTCPGCGRQTPKAMADVMGGGEYCTNCIKDGTADRGVRRFSDLRHPWGDHAHPGGSQAMANGDPRNVYNHLVTEKSEGGHGVDVDRGALSRVNRMHAQVHGEEEFNPYTGWQPKDKPTPTMGSRLDPREAHNGPLHAVVWTNAGDDPGSDVRLFEDPNDAERAYQDMAKEWGVCPECGYDHGSSEHGGSDEGDISIEKTILHPQGRSGPSDRHLAGRRLDPTEAAIEKKVGVCPKCGSEVKVQDPPGPHTKCPSCGWEGDHPKYKSADTSPKRNPLMPVDRTNRGSKITGDHEHPGDQQWGPAEVRDHLRAQRGHQNWTTDRTLDNMSMFELNNEHRMAHGNDPVPPGQGRRSSLERDCQCDHWSHRMSASAEDVMRGQAGDRKIFRWKHKDEPVVMSSHFADEDEFSRMLNFENAYGPPRDLEWYEVNGERRDPSYLTKSSAVKMAYKDTPTDENGKPTIELPKCVDCGKDIFVMEHIPYHYNRNGWPAGTHEDHRPKIPYGHPSQTWASVKMAPGGPHPPYYVRKNSDGQWCVYNEEGETRGRCHDSREEALDQQRAMYVHVPGAKEKAEEEHGDVPADVPSRGAPKESAADPGFGDCPKCGYRPIDGSDFEEHANQNHRNERFDPQDGHPFVSIDEGMPCNVCTGSWGAHSNRTPMEDLPYRDEGFGMAGAKTGAPGEYDELAGIYEQQHKTLKEKGITNSTQPATLPCRHCGEPANFDRLYLSFSAPHATYRYPNCGKETHYRPAEKTSAKEHYHVYMHGSDSPGRVRTDIEQMHGTLDREGALELMDRQEHENPDLTFSVSPCSSSHSDFDRSSSKEASRYHFVVTERRPGYVPDTEPVSFSTKPEAIAYQQLLESEHKELYAGKNNPNRIELASVPCTGPGCPHCERQRFVSSIHESDSGRTKEFEVHGTGFRAVWDALDKAKAEGFAHPTSPDPGSPGGPQPISGQANSMRGEGSWRVRVVDKGFDPDCPACQGKGDHHVGSKVEA